MRRLGLLLAAVAIGVGCGAQSAPKPAGAHSASFSTGAVRTKILGAPPAHRRALTEILAGLGPTPLQEIRVRSAADWEGAEPGSLEVTADTEQSDWLGNWHVLVIARALHARAEELGLAPVNYVSFGNSGSRLGEVGAGKPDLTLPEAQEIARDMRRAAAEHDAEIRTLELVKPRRYAFVLVLQTDDVDRFLDGGYASVLEPLDELGADRYDGRYVEICDAQGRIARVSGAGFLSRARPSGRAHKALQCRGSFKRATDTPPPRAVAIEGGTPGQQQLLREIFAGMGSHQITEARVAPAGPGLQPYEPDSVVLQLTYGSEEPNRAWWEAGLVADAFTDGSRLRDLPPVAWYTTPSQSIRMDGPDPEPVPTSSVTPADLKREAAAAARQADATLVDLEILRPRLLAPVVTLETADPADFLANHARVVLQAFERLALAGYVVRLIDADGHLIWSNLDGVLRPELEGCDPVPLYGGPPDPAPPPCPVD